MNNIGNERLFFSTNILADSVTVSAHTLTYVKHECLKYGEEDLTGFRPKVCGTIQTRIQRKGLNVLRASRGIPFIRDTELIVEGTIERKVLNTEAISERNLTIFAQQLDPAPKTHDITLRTDSNPKVVAKRITN